jgi:hypothetical protein
MADISRMDLDELYRALDDPERAESIPEIEDLIAELEAELYAEKES